MVRAYQRKAALNPSRSHQDRISEIYGSDVALFAAHLSTLNLAARDVNEEENYPRIARRNFFFEVREGEAVLPPAAGVAGERHAAPVDSRS